MMSTQLEIKLKRLIIPIFGIKGIDILVDDAIVASLSLGESKTVEVSAGEHTVKAILHGLIDRNSKVLEVSVKENSTVKIIGTYSRMFGNLQLSSPSS